MNAPARSTLAPPTGRHSELRCSYIWRQEVMADHVAMPGQPITLGSAGASTFTTPRLGLPEGFSILRPGTRGWVLTLGTSMRGRIRIGGEEREVADFVQRGGAGADAVEGSFRATPVGPGDWGCIELAGDPDHVFFFQFVDRDPPIPPPLWVLGPLMAPALAFAILLHGIFITITYLIDRDDNAFVYPGDRDLLTAYLIKRPEDIVEDKEEEKKPEPAAGLEEEKKVEKKPAATMGAQGRAGGKGEKRSTAPDPRKGLPDKPVPKVAFLEDENRKTIGEIADMGGFDEDFGKTLARLKRNEYMAGDSGKGGGSGTGVGDDERGTGTTRGSTGTGSGGGGKETRDVVSSVDAGGERAGRGAGGTKPREVKLDLKGGSGDFSGLSKEEVDRVIRQNAGKFRACYQAALNRDPTLSGKVTVRFVIKDEGSRGVVKRVSIDRGGTTIGSAAVEDCVKSKISGLTFPAKGGAIVTYPFIFSNS